jgi:CheY-like chemotaxis protein
LNFCNVGAMVCDIFGKLSNPCKAGTKSGECPQKKAKMKKAAKKGEQRPDVRSLVGIDQPFNYQEVVSVTGPEYVENYQREGVHFVPYEELKRKWAPAVEGARERKIIDADIPFERGEVEKHAGEQYAQMLGPSDMPVVEMPTAETLLNFCNVGAMVCDIFGKLSNPCKAGNKSGECPQKKAKKKKAAGKTGAGVDVRTLIGIDQPFNYEDVVSVTGPEYALNVQHEGFALLPYAELKNNVSRMMAERAVKATKEVLVIDDEAAVNNNIRKILTKKGYRVEQALTKEEALRKIEEKTYSLILLDLKMPGVEGLELLRAIRSRQKETMVIIITGYASIENAVESARMGAVDYLAKPFTPDELRKATDNLFSIAA